MAHAAALKRAPFGLARRTHCDPLKGLTMHKQILPVLGLLLSMFAIGCGNDDCGQATDFVIECSEGIFDESDRGALEAACRASDEGANTACLDCVAAFDDPCAAAGLECDAQCSTD